MLVPSQKWFLLIFFSSMGLFATSLLAQEKSIPSDCELSKSKPLLQAAEIDDFEKLTALLQEKTNINDTDELGYSALHLATVHGNAQAVKALLEAKADTSLAEHETHYTPLHTAIKRNFPECVRLLLLYGAHPQLKTNYGLSPLFMAFLFLSGHDDAPIGEDPSKVLANRELICKYLLLDKRTDVNEKGQHQLTVLHIAANNDKVELAKELIARGADCFSLNVAGIKPADYPMIQKILSEKATEQI